MSQSVTYFTWVNFVNWCLQEAIFDSNIKINENIFSYFILCILLTTNSLADSFKTESNYCHKTLIAKILRLQTLCDIVNKEMKRTSSASFTLPGNIFKCFYLSVFSSMSFLLSQTTLVFPEEDSGGTLKKQIWNLYLSIWISKLAISFYPVTSKKIQES